MKTSSEEFKSVYVQEREREGEVGLILSWNNTYLESESYFIREDKSSDDVLQTDRQLDR